MDLPGSGRRERCALWACILACAIVVAVISPIVARGDRPGTASSAMDWSVVGPRLLVLPVGPPGSLDAAQVSQPAVVRALNGSYLMYYTGSDGSRNRILAAHSRNGIAWTKLGGSLFLNDGSGSPFLLLIAGTYHLWFESVVWGVGPLGYTDRIFHATSTDGVTWSTPALALDVGNVSDWDGGSVGDPSVAPGAPGDYRMYYTMYAANHTAAIGVATSTDLVTFTKWAGNPVFRPGPSGSWDDYTVANPSVVPGSPWTLFYGGRRSFTRGQIGLATSLDGYTWTRGSAPLLGYDPPGTWDSAGVGDPEFVEGAPPHLYFDGASGTGASEIGMVNVTSASSSGATEGTVLGIPVLAFVLLVLVAGIGVATVLAVLLVLRSGSRRPPESG
ncbi:MAG TPA: hypothetical protein VEY12_05555 [Thermoplasmata archaeon]|nr:hypothetical protein [Thermoplasmata archaeon]